ncbi:hypothetical protein [Oceanirhabdus seepicola]|uniref:Acetyltransferase (GNAT) domain-containing protein n=1 Tax=Oceanirhabdus seepicola TaxID=2828781 RepID=A0A9J6NWD3_9CLOT|nr:hypothetical protein [Oceanirhabdus seepicola]MCM1988233.1 hypothetical protein [Oceanirhabdus seepicola]
MKFQFKPCKMEDINLLMQEYINTLSSPFDSFLDDHIVASEFYLITDTIDSIGYCAIYEGKLLTQFYISFKYLKYGQDIFKSILKEFTIESAFVTTSDELLLSLALDQSEIVKKQAYFFQDNKEVDTSVKLYKNGDFRIANKEDISEIKKVSGDFFDKLEEQVDNNQIFIFTEDNILLGAGIIEKGRVLKGFTSIGMYTNELYRRKGIGRTIIFNLKKWCYENNQIPICGCWYYNENSKMTLESVGFVTKTRLLSIEFTDDARE